LEWLGWPGGRELFKEAFNEDDVSVVMKLNNLKVSRNFGGFSSVSSSEKFPCSQLQFNYTQSLITSHVNSQWNSRNSSTASTRLTPLFHKEAIDYN
jgi:hypothetical protein